MELLRFGYNKVTKGFMVLVKYPLTNSNLLSFNVMWKEGDTKSQFLQRIYKGAVFMENAMKWLSTESLYVMDMIVYANEQKEIYYYLLKIGNGLPNRISYLSATSDDTQTTLCNRVQKIKTSFSTQLTSEKRRAFYESFLSYIGG